MSENQNKQLHFDYIWFSKHLGDFHNVLKFCLQFLHHFLIKKNLQDFLMQRQMFFEL